MVVEHESSLPASIVQGLRQRGHETEDTGGAGSVVQVDTGLLLADAGSILTAEWLRGAGRGQGGQHRPPHRQGGLQEVWRRGGILMQPPPPFLLTQFTCKNWKTPGYDCEFRCTTWVQDCSN